MLCASALPFNIVFNTLKYLYIAFADIDIIILRKMWKVIPFPDPFDTMAILTWILNPGCCRIFSNGSIVGPCSPLPDGVEQTWIELYFVTPVRYYVGILTEIPDGGGGGGGRSGAGGVPILPCPI